MGRINRLIVLVRKSISFGKLPEILLFHALLSGQCIAQVPDFFREDFAEQAAAQAQLLDEDWQEFENGFLVKKAININQVQEEEMHSWGILTPWQIRQFINYRKLFGRFIHVYELQAVPGWYPDLIKMLAPYLKVQQETIFFERKKKWNVQSSFRSTGLPVFLNATDSSANNWLGDSYRLLFQTRLEFAGWKAGLTAKKDSGEPLWKKGISKGFDFYGFHAHWQGKGFVKSFAFGDYTVNLGQGLIHWQAMALRKSGELLWVKRQSPVIKPHRGGGEFNFHRGFATQLQYKSILLTTFFSRRNLTANLSYDDVGIPLGVRSISSSGYHRTSHEIGAKNNLKEWIVGFRISRHHQKLDWGINGISYAYSLPLERGVSPYQLFKINGRSWQNASIDFSYTHKNAHFFGELAVDKLGKKALLAGVILSMDTRIDMAAVVRVLPKEFQSFYANAFTENTSPTNEVGIFCSIAIRPSSQLQFNLYNDFYQFPWLRYQISMPSMGRDHYMQATYKPSRTTTFLVRFRKEQKPEDPSSTFILTPFPQLEVTAKSSLRVHLEKEIARHIQIRFRLEMLSVRSLFSTVEGRKSSELERGFLSYWETNHVFSQRAIKLGLRVQYFDTEGYKSRIYTFLPNPGATSTVSASYGKGFLAGLFLSKKLKNKWLYNLSLLIRKPSLSEGFRLFPGVRVVYDL